jgi:predicted outer membrane repeat protein
LRAALAAIPDNDPTTIHIQVEEIVLESALSAPETGIVNIIGEATGGPTVIHPASGHEHEFRFLTAGVGNNGHFLLKNLGAHSFGTTGDGGAILALGELTLEDCGFSDNVAGGNGGAVASVGLDLTIINSGFGGSSQGEWNIAGNYGGAVYFAPAGGVANSSGGDGGVWGK